MGMVRLASYNVINYYPIHLVSAINFACDNNKLLAGYSEGGSSSSSYSTSEGDDDSESHDDY